MANKVILAILLNILFLAFSTAYSYAYQIPEFPSCTNPSGSIKASYPNGEHGIPGRTQTYVGSDTVYQLNSETLMQCFCPEEGNGIQTNWWKVTGLTEDEIKILKNQGWIYIPNGYLWGLDQAEYLAKNIDYSCSSSTNSDESSSTGSGGASIPETPTVLGVTVPSGFAETGSSKNILFVSALGLMSLALGIYLRNKTS